MCIDRRRFLTTTAAALAGAATSFPAGAAGAARLAPLGSLQVGQPVEAKLGDGTPATLVKLGAACDGGVGPDRDIVGFVPICTHLGCAVAWKGARFVCPCHASQFDPALRGQCYQGPATASLPRLQLAVDGADIVCHGVEGVVWTAPTSEHA
jgi:arsenite oxidase small subunit